MLSAFYHPSLSIRSTPEAVALWRPVKRKRERERVVVVGVVKQIHDVRVHREGEKRGPEG